MTTTTTRTCIIFRTDERERESEREKGTEKRGTTASAHKDGEEQQQHATPCKRETMFAAGHVALSK